VCKNSEKSQIYDELLYYVNDRRQDIVSKWLDVNGFKSLLGMLPCDLGYSFKKINESLCYLVVKTRMILQAQLRGNHIHTGF